VLTMSACFRGCYNNGNIRYRYPLLAYYRLSGFHGHFEG
jgi:hypothetical protein